MEDEEGHDQLPESSQVNLFQDEEEEEEDAGDDLLTQARTQVEQRFMPQTKKARAEAAACQDADVSKYNPRPDQEELVEVRQAYADLNTKFSRKRVIPLSTLNFFYIQPSRARGPLGDGQGD